MEIYLLVSYRNNHPSQGNGPASMAHDRALRFIGAPYWGRKGAWVSRVSRLSSENQAILRCFLGVWLTYGNLICLWPPPMLCQVAAAGPPFLGGARWSCFGTRRNGWAGWQRVAFFFHAFGEHGFLLETKVYTDYLLPLITQTSYHACSGWLSSIFPLGLKLMSCHLPKKFCGETPDLETT